MSQSPKRAAHFLLHPELAYSPPNEAIISALLEQDYEVHLFAPGGNFPVEAYGGRVSAHAVEYGRRWLLRNAFRPAWRQYRLFSATSEDPVAIAGVLSWLHRRRCFLLMDEIRSGSYRGDAPESWKKLCRWSIRRARLNIVNDESRVSLLREYADVPAGNPIAVYPGCYRDPPAPADVGALRQQWGIPDGAPIIAASGLLNLTSGMDWLIQAMQRDPSLHAVIQPLNIDPFARFLLNHLKDRDRMYVQERRLGWRDAWASAAAFDIGLAIYRNPGPQFQNMGISSNRLCMYLAMGVPVIASRQPSLKFLEDYDCGVLVDSSEEFFAAVVSIRARLAEMKANALRCAREYIAAPARYRALADAISRMRP